MLLGSLDDVEQSLTKDRSIDTALRMKVQLREIDDALRKRAEKSRLELIGVVDAEYSLSRHRLDMIAVLSVFTVVIVVIMVRRLVNGVAEPIKQSVDLARHVAQGDLTGQIDARVRRDETGQLMRALHDMQEGLARIVSDVRNGTHSIDVAAREIADGNRDLSARTERQASAIEETAASMEQLASTVKLNAEHARQADQVARGAQSVARKGGEVVQEVVATMSAIRTSSKQIGEITSVIDTIAFQTNILALNAAVEAARAGAHGRGFAVVAAEVRELAQRSADAAGEIRNVIRDSADTVAAAHRLAEQAGHTMADIVTSVQRVSELMAGINMASSEQSVGIDEASMALNSMQDTVQQNASLVEQATAASEALRIQAGRLHDMVNAFKLREVQQVIETPVRAQPREPAQTREPERVQPREPQRPVVRAGVPQRSEDAPIVPTRGRRPQTPVPDSSDVGWEEF